MKGRASALCLFMIILCSFLLSGCIDGNATGSYPDVDRDGSLPSDIQKRGPQSDMYPPIIHSSEFEPPVPMPYPINTSGAEDSPFMLPDGNTIYFFFTPDVRVPVEKQLLDNVTGVWASSFLEGTWSDPQKIWLQDPGKLSLDGAVSIYGAEMFFASAREGYNGVNIFTAELVGNEWVNWAYSGDRLMNEIMIGEVHLHGDDLFFHSDRTGGSGGYDIWVTSRSGGTWSDPINIGPVNTPGMDGFPFISPDGSELWFTRTYMGTPGIFRSRHVDGTWQGPELIISQFAGEPTLDAHGNLYFVHHYYENGVMIEADIYFSSRK